MAFGGGWGGDACRALGAGAAGLSQVPQLQRLLEDLRGGAPGGDSPQCRQGEWGAPLLLQEELVAQSSDPLVHR